MWHQPRSQGTGSEILGRHPGVLPIRLLNANSHLFSWAPRGFSGDCCYCTSLSAVQQGSVAWLMVDFLRLMVLGNINLLSLGIGSEAAWKFMATMCLSQVIQGQIHNRSHMFDLVFLLQQRHNALDLGKILISLLSWSEQMVNLQFIGNPYPWEAGSIRSAHSRWQMDPAGFQRELGIVLEGLHSLAKPWWSLGMEEWSQLWTRLYKNGLSVPTVPITPYSKRRAEETKEN